MRRVRILGICIAAALLVSGCASHRYRVKETGVHFYLRAPTADSVAMCSSLHGFEPRAAVKKSDGDGVWVVVLPAEAPFSYFYLVDERVFVPPCPLMENDGFGAKNCIFDPDL